MTAQAVASAGRRRDVDLRNGLYVLRYGGAFQKEVQRIRFLDGNSNQGDALCFEPVGTAPSSCD